MLMGLLIVVMVNHVARVVLCLPRLVVAMFRLNVNSTFVQLHGRHLHKKQKMKSPNLVKNLPGYCGSGDIVIKYLTDHLLYGNFIK